MTVDEIREAVRARGFEIDTDAQQLSMLNQIQRQVVGGHRWKWTLASAAQALVVGQADYAWPADAQHLGALLIEQNAPHSDGLLTAVDPDRLLDQQARITTDTGVPRFWATTAPRTVTLLPAPDRTGTLTIRYHMEAPLLTLGTDVPIVPLGYHDVLVLGVCKAMSMRERLWQSVDGFDAEYAARMRSMMAQEGIDQTATSTRVQSSGFYGPTSLYGEDYDNQG